MTATLDMFQVLGSAKPRAKRQEPSPEDRRQAGWLAASNALLAMGYLADEHAAFVRKRDRIQARLDDPANAHVADGREEATLYLFDIQQEIKQREIELAGWAKGLRIAWPKLDEADRRWIVEELPPRWHGSPMWDLVEANEELMAMEMWPAMVASARCPAAHVAPF